LSDSTLRSNGGIPEQQNLAGRTISLMILCARTNRLSDLELLVPAAISALDSIGTGAVVRIREKECG
jgi:hypothetical protein